jgi:hypothetical protein
MARSQFTRLSLTLTGAGTLLNLFSRTLTGATLPITLKKRFPPDPERAKLSEPFSRILRKLEEQEGK